MGRKCVAPFGRYTGKAIRPFLPSSMSDNAARSFTEFFAKKSAVSFFFVASSASAFAPFSQYAAIGDRSPSSSGHAQLEQSKPPFWFIFARPFRPRTTPASAKTSLIAAITPGRPAAQVFGSVTFRWDRCSGPSAEGSWLSAGGCGDGLSAEGRCCDGSLIVLRFQPPGGGPGALLSKY